MNMNLSERGAGCALQLAWIFACGVIAALATGLLAVRQPFAGQLIGAAMLLGWLTSGRFAPRTLWQKRQERDGG